MIRMKVTNEITLEVGFGVHWAQNNLESVWLLRSLGLVGSWGCAGWSPVPLHAL